MTAWEEGPEFHTTTEYACEVCGKTLTATAKEAYEIGWDTPPYFTAAYIKCENCPITGTLWYRLIYEAKTKK